MTPVFVVEPDEVRTVERANASSVRAGSAVDEVTGSHHGSIPDIGVEDVAGP